MYGKQLGPVGPLPVGLITGLVVLKSEGSLPQPHPQPAATGPLALPAPTGDLRPLVPASQTGVLQGQLQPCPLATSRGPREGSRGPGRAGPALRHGRGSGLASAPCQCEAAGPRAGGLSGAAHVQQGGTGCTQPHAARCRPRGLPAGLRASAAPAAAPCLVSVRPGRARRAGQECVRGATARPAAASRNRLPLAYGSPGDTPVGGQERRLVGREQAPAWGGVRPYM